MRGKDLYQAAAEAEDDMPAGTWRVTKGPLALWRRRFWAALSAHVAGTGSALRGEGRGVRIGGIATVGLKTRSCCEIGSDDLN